MTINEQSIEELRAAKLEFELAQDALAPVLVSAIDKVAAAFRDFAATLAAGLGERAPVRRRPWRVAKKIKARGGFLHYDSVGAIMTAAVRESPHLDGHGPRSRDVVIDGPDGA